MHFNKIRNFDIAYKNAVFKGFFSCFYPLNVFRRVMYSEPLKGYFCIWKILSCPLRGRTGK